MTEIIINWLLTWQFWAILGSVLITLEIFDGHGIAVSLGLSAFIMTSLILSEGFLKVNLTPDWKLALLLYAVISLVLAYFVRKLPMFRGSQDKDVNDY